MILTTERLLLRPWDEADAANLFLYAKDPDVGPIAGWPPHKNEEESLLVIRTVFAVPECYAICEKDDGVAIGAVALKLKGQTDMTDREDECELGYWLGKPEDLSMRAVWCGYYEGNLKSKRVQEKLGFEYRYTHSAVPVPLMHETRIGHTNRLTREQWQMRTKE